MSVHSRGIGPGGSAALIQAGLTQVGRAAKQPGRTVCFMLFIEMSYKSSPVASRGLGCALAEPGAIAQVGGARRCPSCVATG